MRQQLRRRPQLESLESMALLSGMMAAPVAALVATTTPMTGHEVDINGTAHGKYHEHQSNPDTGKTYTFNGSGRLMFGLDAANKGVHADVTGNIHTLGNIATGNAGGQVFISTPRGTLTLTLTGPPQNGFAAIPDTFTFRVTNASGKYLHDHGRGTVVLVLDPAKATPTTTTTTPAEHGTFTMVFLSLPDTTPTA